jgi:hypothetical protein
MSPSSPIVQSWLSLAMFGLLSRFIDFDEIAASGPRTERPVLIVGAANVSTGKLAKFVSNRLRGPADQKFTRLVELIRESQLAGAIQIRTERPKDGAESSVLIFGPSKDPQLAAKAPKQKTSSG